MRILIGTTLLVGPSDYETLPRLDGLSIDHVRVIRAARVDGSRGSIFLFFIYGYSQIQVKRAWIDFSFLFSFFATTLSNAKMSTNMARIAGGGNPFFPPRHASKMYATAEIVTETCQPAIPALK